MWSRKLAENSAYSTGSLTNFINSIFGNDGPCLVASAVTRPEPTS